MSSAQIAALRRLLLIVLAWAIVETVFLLVLRQPGLATLAGAAAGALAFYLTRNAVLRRRKRGDVIYWRGRAIDRDDWN